MKITASKPRLCEDQQSCMAKFVDHRKSSKAIRVVKQPLMKLATSLQTGANTELNALNHYTQENGFDLTDRKVQKSWV